jgi:hypothetical protein
MQMLVYVVEDAAGNRKRVTTPKEIEGMQLIEVTTEEARKLVSITSIKEFERLYAIFKRSSNSRRPGYLAFRQFIDYCNKKHILIIDEIWLYLKKVLVDEIAEKITLLHDNRSKFPNAYPEELFKESIAKIEAQGIAVGFWKAERNKYERANKEQILQARFGKKVA